MHWTPSLRSSALRSPMFSVGVALVGCGGSDGSDAYSVAWQSGSCPEVWRIDLNRAQWVDVQ